MSDEGFVYVLTNEAMPGYVKIGLTRGDDVAVRIRQLDNTSTPLPFQAFYSARVPDCGRLERTLHFVFGEKRKRLNREFFQIEPDLAKAIIELVALDEEILTDQEQAISPAQREEIEEVKRARSGRMTLEKLGLFPGRVLTFTKDPSVTCEVAGPRTVIFKGQEQTLSGAALQAVHDMGYQWPTVNGFDYWSVDGVKLSAMVPPAT